jgi:hypothetical protein
MGWWVPPSLAQTKQRRGEPNWHGKPRPVVVVDTKVLVGVVAPVSPF